MIKLSEIKFVSYRNYWYRCLNNSSVICTEGEFKVYFKAAMIQYEQAKLNYSPDSKVLKKSERRYNFYLKQINQNESDYFTLMMYPTIDWRV